MTTNTTPVHVSAVRPDVLHIEPHIYEAIAQKLLEEIGTHDYITATLEIEVGNRYFRLVCACIVYRRTEQRPEGVFEVVSDVVPVWWELHSYEDWKEVVNDATFERIREQFRNQSF